MATAKKPRSASTRDKPLSVEPDSRWKTPGIRAESRGVTVEQVMSGDVVTIRPTDTVPKAAQAMRDNNLGFLAVTEPDRTVAGVVTDRDLVVRHLADELPYSTLVEAVMTAEVVTCHAGDDLGVAEALMGENQISRVVVLGDDELLAGVISLADLAEYEESCRVGEVAADVATREVDPR